MLWIVALILLVLWLFGVIWAHIIGAFVHIFLILAVIVVALQIRRGIRRA